MVQLAGGGGPEDPRVAALRAREAQTRARAPQVHQQIQHDRAPNTIANMAEELNPDRGNDSWFGTVLHGLEEAGAASNRWQGRLLSGIGDIPASIGQLADSVLSGETGPGEAGMAMLQDIEHRWDPRNLAESFGGTPAPMFLDIAGAAGIAGGIGTGLDRLAEFRAPAVNPGAPSEAAGITSRLTNAEEASAQDAFVRNLDNARSNRVTRDYDPNSPELQAEYAQYVDESMARNGDSLGLPADNLVGSAESFNRIKGTDPRLSPSVDQIGRGNLDNSFMARRANQLSEELYNQQTFTSNPSDNWSPNQFDNPVHFGPEDVWAPGLRGKAQQFYWDKIDPTLQRLLHEERGGGEIGPKPDNSFEALLQRMSDDTGVPVEQLRAEQMRMEIGKGPIWTQNGELTPKGQALQQAWTKEPGYAPTPVGMQMEQNMAADTTRATLGDTINNLMKQDTGETRQAANIVEGTSPMTKRIGGEYDFAPSGRFDKNTGEYVNTSGTYAGNNPFPNNMPVDTRPTPGGYNPIDQLSGNESLALNSPRVKPPDMVPTADLANIEVDAFGAMARQMAEGGATNTDYAALKADIAQNGVREPIVIRVNSDGTQELLAGRHRLQAAQELGIEQIPVKYEYESPPSTIESLTEAQLGGSEGGRYVPPGYRQQVEPPPQYEARVPPLMQTQPWNTGPQQLEMFPLGKTVEQLLEWYREQGLGRL